MSKKTNLLIIGAGPFGLSLAAYAQHFRLDYLILGKNMGFWKDNMPEGMYLRSASDWHLDPLDEHTLEYYIETLGKKPADVEPLSLEFYLSYCEWFRQQKNIEPLDLHVDFLEKEGEVFVAHLKSGESIIADRVVLALGFKYFRNLPSKLTAMIPEGRWGHTCEDVQLYKMKDKRCMIIGGRQSAFEWTALLNEAGAKAVHVVHRHATPSFVEADWSWVPPIVDGMVEDPAWFRNLSEKEKKEVDSRLWAEGRLKIEPWLDERVHRDSVRLWPHTELAGCTEKENGSLNVTLSNGIAVEVDHIFLATGYRVEVSQIPFLKDSPMLSHISSNQGYPVLDESMQTSIPGLYMTSMAAVQDFGPFFGFTVSVRTSAKIIGASLLEAAGV